MVYVIIESISILPSIYQSTNLWYVGTPPRAAKRGALPDPPP